MTVRPLRAHEKSAFINCPFDSEYRDLLLANVFSVFAHGFVPRTARETEGNADSRSVTIQGRRGRERSQAQHAA